MLAFRDSIHPSFQIRLPIYPSAHAQCGAHACLACPSVSPAVLLMLWRRALRYLPNRRLRFEYPDLYDSDDRMVPVDSDANLLVHEEVERLVMGSSIV
jgi:hypothetical protein